MRVVENLVQYVAGDEAADKHPRDKGVELLEVEAPRTSAAVGERSADEHARRNEETERVKRQPPEVEEMEIGDLDIRDHVGGSGLLENVGAYWTATRTLRLAPSRASCPQAALTSSPLRRRMKHE
jgi:hypothetical protein